MRWLTVFLLVITGCSATGQPPAPPSPPPPAPATRALVAWADKACQQVKGFDSVRAQLGQGMSDPDTQVDGYFRSLEPVIGQVHDGFKQLPPSGLKAADDYVANMLKTLDGIRSQIPPADTPQAEKIGKVKQLATVVTAVEPQAPKLAGLAENTRELVLSYNVAPGCDPAKQHDERARALLTWSNVMCETTRSLQAMDTKPLDSPVFTDPRYGRVVGVQLSMYINSAADPLKQAAAKLGALQPTGITQADEYRAEVLGAIQAALPKLPERDPTASMISELPDEELKKQVIQIAQTLETAKPKQRPDLAFGNPELSIAHTLAPECEPPASSTTMPTASNGTDLKACESGKCQIQVTGTVEVVMKGTKFKITVNSSGVSVAHDTGLLQLGTKGEGSFGDNSGTVSFKLAGLQDTTAVLDITAS